VDWEQRTVTIPTGSHKLRWAYTKDVGAAGADAGWVDQVNWTAENNVGSAPDSLLSRHCRKVHSLLAGRRRPYQPEYTESLTSPNWVSLVETPSNAGGVFTVTVAAAEPARFFRLRRQ
jgi:hypothetical protein